MRERSGVMIVELGPAPSGLGEPAQWILDGLGIAPSRCPIIRPWQGDVLPPIRQCAGAVFSGSPSMVTEPEEWHQRAFDWLDTALEAQRPLLGICYGHQLIAQVIGATVDWNPLGQECGQVEIRLEPAVQKDVLFSGLEDPFPAYACHRQSVTELSRFATILGGNDHDGFQAFRWRDYVWGVQFHPEFDERIMAGYIAASAEVLRDEGRDPQELIDALDGRGNASRQILKRFARLAR